MNILVTGSSGEIGTNLSLRLQKEGHRVIGIDKRANTWTDAIETLEFDLSQRVKDYSKGFDDTVLPFTPDIVVHLAANAKVHELVEHPDRAMDNISDAFTVLEYCRAHKLPIIFASSREVYGDIHRFGESTQTINEVKADHVYTESPYSASKIAGEALVYSYARCYDIPYIVLRFSNVYGRYDNDLERMERVIPLFIKRISEKKPITVFGEDKVLDFTYVDDCVSGITSSIETLTSGTVKNETINLAFGEGHSLVKLVALIENELGTKANMVIEPSKVGEVTHYIADISKAKELLGYAPQTSLPEGVKKTIQWWRETNALSQ